GPASDVYSLGAVLYALVTGRAPFPPGGIAETIRRVRRGDFAPPRRVNRRVPRALDAICRRAMATDPCERYAGALDLARDVERWLAGEPVASWREPLAYKARRLIARHPTA